mmetsp:Transcript_2912/g.4447  ORF Transcript_2912/g.4447 Transcript_2912/m.4447 type:complete len:345 (+) Transcript_2912:196-1230(+)
MIRPRATIRHQFTQQQHQQSSLLVLEQQDVSPSAQSSSGDIRPKQQQKSSRQRRSSNRFAILFLTLLSSVPVINLAYYSFFSSETSIDLEEGSAVNVDETFYDILTTFRVPPIDYLVANSSKEGFPGGQVRYLRNKHEFMARGQLLTCKPVLDVFAWLMDEVNARNHTLMLAYGDLIHFHREKDFMNKTTGKYFDEDDLDLWASLETVSHVEQLEPALFRRFGWTMRAFVNGDNYIQFLQMMSTCGHTPINEASKVQSNQPSIEIYPIAVIPINGSLIARDLWQLSDFPESMIYPRRHISFNSTGASRTLHLQLPNKDLEIMACLYGNWTKPSTDHARMVNKCN